MHSTTENIFKEKEMAKIYDLHRLLPNNEFKVEDEDTVRNIITMIENEENLDIRNVAKANFVSPSSITRLAKRSGFNNFKEMIYFLTQSVMDSDLKKIEDLPYVSCNKEQVVVEDLFEKAFRDKRIYLYGEGFCKILVSYTYRKLLLKKTFAVDLDGVEMDIVSNGLPYIMLIFSQSGENSRGIKKIEECQKHGGKAIAFTPTKGSTFVKNADLSFIIENGPDKLERENQSLNYFYGNCLNVIEYLIYKYS